MTGVIYLVIIALWAAVLIPLWLRRHDQISEVRSTARFHSAMRSLGSSRGHMINEYESAREAGAMSDFEDDDFDYDTVQSLRSTDRAAVSEQAAKRRAIVLGTLSGLLLLTLALAFMSILPKWVPALAVLPVIGFLVAQSMTASQRSGTSARPASRSADTYSSRSSRTSRSTSTSRAEEPVRESVPAGAPSSANDDWETWNAWDDEDSWDAVPTTLPTYVTKPRASQVPRRIDRSRPGEWTGTAMVETAQAMRAEQRVDAGAATAEIPVVRAPQARAVNE